jgi:DNA-binding MarR family transcriptional regulator
MENAPESHASAYLNQSAHLNYGFTIEKTMKRIKQNLQRRFNKHHFGVTVDQWVVLDCVHQQDALSQNEIAEATFKDAPTVTRIIDQLCTKGLAVREPDPQDRRRFNISLTDKGHKKVGQIQPVVLAMRQDGWQGLTEDDYHQLMRVLNRVFGNLD